ncbi:hypothetical protein LSM04_007646 [Trypanosoma melophagium]|uniref:uncharacterized protein n=1 Tax=Trypanosoma melophagium TaxID=715481 RepID=UPI00351A1E20|nr:hypothetical protein LSM04_007646 [Trypanosoma melophagium]
MRFPTMPPTPAEKGNKKTTLKSTNCLLLESKMLIDEHDGFSRAGTRTFGRPRTIQEIWRYVKARAFQYLTNAFHFRGNPGADISFFRWPGLPPGKNPSGHRVGHAAAGNEFLEKGLAASSGRRRRWLQRGLGVTRCGGNRPRRLGANGGRANAHPAASQRVLSGPFFARAWCLCGRLCLPASGAISVFGERRWEQQYPPRWWVAENLDKRGKRITQNMQQRRVTPRERQGNTESNLGS